MNGFEQKFRVRETDDAFNNWTVADGTNYKNTQNYLDKYGSGITHCHAFDTEAKAQAALDLYLEKQKQNEQSEHTFVGHPDRGLELRTFDSGATRDTTQGKLDYVKALSPIVLRRYVQYLDKHRLQSDGSYRDFDNWKKGIPQETYHSSGGRHFFDAWLLTEGYTTEDNHGPVELQDALCAQLFNIMGRLHEVLKVKETKSVDRTKPVPGGY